MNEAFRRLVDGGAEVSVDTGLRAAEKLQSVLDRRSKGPDIAEMMAQVNHIISVVKPTVPQSKWPEIVRKLKCEDEASEVLEDNFIVGSPLAVALASRALSRWCLGRHGWRDDMRRGLAMARSADFISYAKVVGYVYNPGIRMRAGGG